MENKEKRLTLSDFKVKSAHSEKENLKLISGGVLGACHDQTCTVSIGTYCWGFLCMTWKTISCIDY